LWALLHKEACLYCKNDIRGKNASHSLKTLHTLGDVGIE